MDDELNKNTQVLNSIVGNFFFGEIEEDKVFPFPGFTTEQKELAKEMINAVAKFCEDNIDSEKMDQNEEIPKEVIQGLAELGLCGLGVPETYGGLELDYALYSRVFSEICRFDGAVATTLGAHQSIGYRALLNEGTEQQKEKYLARLASGEMIAAFCLTEPGSGSDAYSIKTKAVKKEDGNWAINGQKLWITNAGMADFYTVFCKTEQKNAADEVVEKISCFIIEKDTPGLSFGEREKKMGIKASETRALYFDNVIVPAENLLGAEGKGFKIAMNVLNSGRLSLGSGCVGGMSHIIKLTTAQAKGRKQFGRTITEFGLVQEKLALMAAKCYATECIVYMTTGNMVRGMKDYFMETAVCKIYGSESLWSCIDMAMQVAAGNGYMKEYPYERIMRDSRINLIFEGTNEILRCFVALSGMRGPSEKLKELGKITDVSKALSDPIKSLGVLTDFAKSRISKMIVSKTLSQCHPELEDQAAHLSNLVSDFAIAVENTLIKYGKKIIDHELPQGRLADMAVHLYVTLAVLSRTTAILNDQKIPQDKKDYCLHLAKISCRDAKKEIAKNMKAMKKNSDKSIAAVTESICKYDGYGLDIVDY